MRRLAHRVPGARAAALAWAVVGVALAGCLGGQDVAPDAVSGSADTWRVWTVAERGNVLREALVSVESTGPHPFVDAYGRPADAATLSVEAWRRDIYADDGWKILPVQYLLQEGRGPVARVEPLDGTVFHHYRGILEMPALPEAGILWAMTFEGSFGPVDGVSFVAAESTDCGQGSKALSPASNPSVTLCVDDGRVSRTAVQDRNTIHFAQPAGPPTLHVQAPSPLVDLAPPATQPTWRVDTPLRGIDLLPWGTPELEARIEQAVQALARHPEFVTAFGLGEAGITATHMTFFPATPWGVDGARAVDHNAFFFWVEDAGTWVNSVVSEHGAGGPSVYRVGNIRTYEIDRGDRSVADSVPGRDLRVVAEQAFSIDATAWMHHIFLTASGPHPFWVFFPPCDSTSRPYVALSAVNGQALVAGDNMVSPNGLCGYHLPRMTGGASTPTQESGMVTLPPLA